MSKTIEFIEKEIEFLKDMINMGLALIEDDFDLQEIRKKQNRLRHLEQIKCELEAYDELKQPKKPRIEKVLWATNSTSNDYIINHYCPNCNEPLNKFTHNYCNKCGTKIDWSDDNE